MNVFALAAGIGELGSSPVRFFEFGTAPQLTAAPYATWQTLSLTPENLLSEAPLLDRIMVQIDIWATDGAEARAIGRQFRSALTEGYLTHWREEPPGADSPLYRVSLDLVYYEGA